MRASAFSPAQPGQARSVLPDEVTQERIAHNDATFRAANEKLRATAESLGLDDWVPFFCECAEPACHELVPMSLADYAEVRSDGRHFLCLRGHEVAAHGTARVIESRARYEKVGVAGEIAERLNGGAPEA